MIQLSSVSKRLGGQQVLDFVDLEVPPGSLVGLIGLNGAGKTTTLRIALGLLRPDRGAATVLGQDARRLASLTGRIGAFMHGVGLDGSLTARQNLVLHALQHGRRGVDCGPILERLDLERLAGRRVSKLSQGERQRLALARALLLEPDVLILDEPLSHLDPGAVDGILDLLAEEVRRRGVAVLLSSHQLDLVERAASRFALIHRGKLLLSGTLEELLASTDRALRIGVDLPGRAAEILQQAQGVAAVHPAASGAPELRVSLAGASPAELNAALIEAGLKVHLLAPERRGLHELFRDAVRDADRRQVPA